MAAVIEANKEQGNTGTRNNDISLISMDAEALYPSLDRQDITQAIWNLLIDTDHDLRNFDYREIGKYLAVKMTKDDLRKHNVIRCIPRRQVELDGRSRAQPGLPYLDSDMYRRTDNVIKGPMTDKWN